MTKKNNQQSDIEQRTFCREVRALENEDGGVTITGYGAVFNTLSEPMWGFREQIAPGAFDDVIGDDVRALFNHDSNFVLGRNGKTLHLTVDQTGLRYEIDAPDTQMVKDLVISPMKRGDIDQSSFAFTVEDEKWEEDDEGRIIRTILKVKRLYDVSPVTYPAYTAASSTVRSFDKFKNDNADTDEQSALKEINWRSYVKRDLETL